MASGLLLEPLIDLGDIVAASGAFQAWTGCATAETAAARVHLVEAPVGATLPLAVVDLGDGWQDDPAGVGGAWTMDGNLLVYLGDQVAEDATELEAMLTFLGHVEDVWADLRRLSPRLPITSIRSILRPQRMTYDDRQGHDLVEVVLAIGYRRTDR